MRSSPKLYRALLFTISFLLVFTIFSYYLNPDFESINNLDKLPPDHCDINCPPKEEYSLSECQHIHIAVVCGGYNSTRSFYVLLKSILFYRTDIIHLHLFVDNIAHKVLDNLFRTWVVPDLHINYYNVSNHEHEVAWLTNLHYSGHYGLMKLILLDAIARKADDIPKLIVLDTDMLVLGDIKSIWNEFIRFHSDEAMGLVENQSQWYLGVTINIKSDQKMAPNLIDGSSGRVWPALGRGFNTGLILADLIQLRRQNWTQTWRQVAESELTSHSSTTLADQDILNAYIKSHPNLVHKLPCQYNMQLNDHANIQNCKLNSRANVKILHWNSPYKLATKNREAQLYKNWYVTFRNWDASLLEQSVCTKGLNYDETLDDNSTDIANCKDLRPRPRDRLRTYLYLFNFELDKLDERVDVTICTQLSLDRLQTLDELALHWRGPISAAIYLSESDTNLLMASIETSNNLASRRNIGYHLIFRDHGFNYPINRMRNIALENALTPYVFLSDIDFLPSYNLYDHLRQVIGDTMQSSIGSSTTQSPLAKTALVVPAFENLQYKFEFPLNKNELISQLNLGTISTFREQIWPLGQAATDYNKWLVTTQLYQVQWQPEYEPFVVVNRREVPKFDERFVGFGWNKVEHIMQLAALDYKFLVLPEGFAVHKLHAASYDILQHRESQKYRTCIRQLRRNFLLELKANYPSFFKSINATTSTVTTTTFSES